MKKEKKDHLRVIKIIKIIIIEKKLNNYTLVFINLFIAITYLYLL